MENYRNYYNKCPNCQEYYTDNYCENCGYSNKNEKRDDKNE